MFGFLKGKIELTLAKYQFSPGEEISGKLVLTLKKSIKARGVFVRLYGTERVTKGSGQNRRTDMETLFDFSLPLDGEKEYVVSEQYSYDFNLKIPEDVLSGKAGPSFGANIGFGEGGLQIGTSLGTRRIDWYVEGKLDSPGFDVKKKVKVNIA